MTDREQARKLIQPFYDMLNRPGEKDVRPLAEAILAPDWRSYSGEQTSKGRDEFIQQLAGFGKLLPDLAWAVRDVLVDGDRIVVRGEASATPAGDFFGVPHGGRSFRVMSIDIHSVRDGKLVAAYHVEDWAAALRQLAGR